MNALRIAMIGFGEVGTTFARGFLSLDGCEVAAYDILVANERRRDALTEKAKSAGVRLCGSAREAARDAAVVFSAVTADSAFDVAREAASYLAPGQFFVDVNSVSPTTKRRDAEEVESSGARYVEAAVMAPVAPYGLRTPIILGGPHAQALRDLLGFAMRLEVGEPEVGKASALKLCRSVMVKGLEALAVECFMSARLYGVEEKVLASLAVSYPGLDWEKLAGYHIARTIEHGRRRAAEMREAAQTVGETGLEPVMADAIARRIDWVADRVAARQSLKAKADEEWRSALDEIAEDAGLRRIAQSRA